MTFHQLRFLPWPHIPWPWPTFCRSPRAPGPWWCCRSSSRLHSASWRWSGRSGVSPGLSPPNWKRRNHVKTMWKPKEHDLHMIIKWIQMMGVLWFSLLELLDSLQSQCKVVILANPNPILQHVGVVPWENYIMHVTQMDHIFWRASLLVQNQPVENGWFRAHDPQGQWISITIIQGGMKGRGAGFISCKYQITIHLLTISH